MADTQGQTPGGQRRHGLGALPYLGAAAGAVVVSGLVAGAAAYVTQPGISDRLGTQVAERLQQEGIQGRVEVDGRDATISGVTAGQGDRAQRVAQQVAGVRTAEVEAGTGAQTRPAMLRLSRQGGSLTVSGEVPDERSEQELLSAAREAAGGAWPQDRVTVRSGAVLPAAAAAVGGLAEVLPEGDEAGLTVQDETVTLTGTVEDDGAKESAAQRVRSVLPQRQLDNQLTVRPTSSGPPASSSAPAVDPAALQQRVDGVLAQHPVRFPPDSAELTPEAAVALDQVAAELTSIPSGALTVRVDGHAAPTPGNGPRAIELSQQRAAAAVTALVQRGVPEELLQPKGFGDSMPKPHSDTASGRAASRRVEVTVV